MKNWLDTFPGRAYSPGGQRSADGNFPILLFPGDPPLGEEVHIGPLGPLHEAAMAGEHSAAPEDQGDGNEEAEGGAGLPAVEPRQFPALGPPSPVTCDADSAGGYLLPGGPQGLHTPEGGLHILGEGHVLNGAGPLRQGGGNNEAVCLGFAGGRRHRARQLLWYNGQIHSAASTNSFSSAIVSRTVSARPISRRTTTSMWSPLRFLSPAAAASSSWAE